MCDLVAYSKNCARRFMSEDTLAVDDQWADAAGVPEVEIGAADACATDVD